MSEFKRPSCAYNPNMFGDAFYGSGAGETVTRSLQTTLQDSRSGPVNGAVIGNQRIWYWSFLLSDHDFEDLSQLSEKDGRLT